MSKKNVVSAMLAFLFLLTMVMNGTYTAHAAGKDVPVNDPNIKYFGRWDKSSSTQYLSNWVGEYFTVNFTGTTVSIKVASSISFYAKIDGGSDVKYTNVSGTVNLTPTPLANGVHSLRITVAQGTEMTFQGLVIDSTASTKPPVVQASKIQFIGDSITTGASSRDNDADQDPTLLGYAWLTAEELNAEHIQIAQGGIGLVSGYSTPLGTTGMDTQYFKQGSFSNNTTFTAWSDEKPDIIVINLGQNDASMSTNKVPMETFQSTYEQFIKDIRAKQPDAQIFAMRIFSDWGEKGTRIKNAVDNVVASTGDKKVHFIDTNGWILKDPNQNDPTTGLPDIKQDWSHPTKQGHRKIANKLKNVLSPFVSTWNKCADENGQCTFTGTKTVRYGAGISYNTLSLTNGTACTNGVFGDPIQGTAKHCDIIEPKKNLALNKTTVTSSNENSTLTGAQAVDGNQQTRWGSAWSNNQWIYVDLGTSQTISRVKLTWQYAYGSSYKIQVSNDATNWTDIYSTTTGNGGTDDLIGLSGSGRYVRMLGIARGTQYGYSLHEFEVYGL